MFAHPSKTKRMRSSRIVDSLSQIMTKRPFPFESSMGRQLKIHLSNYENDSFALNDLKERTLKRLLEGPKKLQSSSLANGLDCGSVEKPLQSNNNVVQKNITNYITVNGRKVKLSNRNFIKPTESASCCFFCESRTNLTFQCIHCLEFYCTDCSFISYETFEDKRICLSCS